ncbi:transcription termination factor Rho [Rubritalea halochordaticola]|uniref:Transcription termination factor Rho n=1 Tax=Rubritalea halochordaticola TaxID=714537 RepID=A0ABP9V479_9BACT
MSEAKTEGVTPEEKAAPKKKTAKKAAKKATAKKAAKKTTKKVAAKKTAKKAAKKVAAKKVAADSAQAELNFVAESSASPAPKAEKKPAAKAKKQPAPKAESTEAPVKEAKAATETKSPSPAPEAQAAPVKESDSRDKQQNDQNRDNSQKRNHHGRQNKNEGRQRHGRVKGGGRVDRNSNNNRNKGRNKKNNRHNNNKSQHEDRERKPVELTGDPVAVGGILELSSKGFGFLRELNKGLDQSRDDVFVTPELIRSLGLRDGVWIKGVAKQGPRGLQVTEIKDVNGMKPEAARKLPHFEELKAVNPDKRIPFETTPERFTTRVVDIISPVGRGQRGLIVSPPRSGKTTLMMHMAEAVREKYSEDLHLMILLVDERPEEVTEFKRSLPDAEIYASSNDSGAKNHCRVAEIAIERAKRLVEAGQHVFLMMDSITRLARAYNTAMGGDKKSRGRGIQSGGIIGGALEMPRRLFASARNTRNAGSLTIIATALVHTNSRADDAIFQEFKGTGNMELVLDRRIAEQYIYPAVDIFKSGTRREELLLPEHILHKIHLIRRGLSGHRPHEAMERLIFFLKRFHSNAQMMLEIKG